MKKPMVRIHDLATNEVIDREMNDLEFAEYEAEQTARIAAENELIAKTNAKSALLEKLGLSAEEAKLLLS
jgi:hypothetical protein